MYFILKNHSFVYEVQTIIQVFFPNQHYAQIEAVSEEGFTVVSELLDNCCRALLFENGTKISEATVSFHQENSKGKSIIRYIKRSVYDILKGYKHFKPSWGMLTGIRPTKIIFELWDMGLSNAEISAFLSKEDDVSGEKINLAITVAEHEKIILEKYRKDSVSLYVGIPFCPTRCTYCSFTSYPLLQYEKTGRVDKYLACIEKELFHLKNYCKTRDIESIYIGGGTPTSLNEKQLDYLLNIICSYFDISNVKEFTVEAGRPDTINIEKLNILKNYNVSRISINPQSLNDISLSKIGRSHSVLDFYKAYELAQKVSFDNINVDLILGLPDETLQDVYHTFSQIEKLEKIPDSITIHTLAVKRASKIKEQLDSLTFSNLQQIDDMLKFSFDKTAQMGMHPYYLYRQKNMIGNFENVGYSLPNKECLYNILIMEEKQSILAAGSGAITKLVDLHTNRIERVFNVKNVDEYILRIDEMIERKVAGGIC